MELFAYTAIRHQLDELKYSMLVNGARFVTMPGILMMLTWCAGSLASKKLHKLTAAPLMVRDPGRYGWMTWHAREASRIFTTADTVDGENMIAPIAETPA